MAPETTIAKLDRDLSPEEKEAFHLEAEGRMKMFSYRKPESKSAWKRCRPAWKYQVGVDDRSSGT